MIATIKKYTFDPLLTYLNKIIIERVRFNNISVFNPGVYFIRIIVDASYGYIEFIPIMPVFLINFIKDTRELLILMMSKILLDII